ncbi:MAG TPA: hypothetical protein VFK13_03295 [Gemmatimonadaceae bacterium]|nr:hypothetical protein [Gemmatimonadaceae bacterium]
MSVSVQVHQGVAAAPRVAYRWDADTDILTATMEETPGNGGMSGSVELTGRDGSWVMLDVQRGAIRSIEVAVWPDVCKLPLLAPPAPVESAAVSVPVSRPARPVELLHVDTTMRVEADDAERTIRFRVGSTPPARTVRIANDVLLDLDERDALAGIWLLNVPPFPAEA